LNESAAKATPAREKGTKSKPVVKDLEVPEDLMAALRKNRQALAAFEGFSPSHRKEYVEWITDAKREVTRQKRLATAIEWLADGKPRHWKYMK
jgi:uncharacterized protein YdeI (YjbR/CyaY-like superfamily)